MSDEEPAVEESPKRLLVPALVVATAAVSASTSIFTLFMVDIASTFNVSVGIASQLATANYAGEFVFSLLMSVLVVRFRHKTLILAGILITVISAIGNFCAPDFSIMQVFFVMEGIGTVIVSVISLTLFGDLLNPKKRAGPVSYLLAAVWVTALISFPWAGFIANVAGWRFVFVLQILPISIAGLILALFAVPSKSHLQTGSVKRLSTIESFKQILENKSAIACLAGHVLSTAGPGMAIYGVAFYRERFSMTRDFAVVLSLAVIVFHIIGSLVAGRITNRVGAKPITVTSKMLAGTSTILFFLMPNLWGALFFNFLQVWFSALVGPSYTYLALAQVPKSRGTMMSLFRTTASLARTIAPAVGGALFVLTFGIYEAVGLALGGMSIAAAILLLLWAKDPTRTYLRIRDAR